MIRRVDERSKSKPASMAAGLLRRRSGGATAAGAMQERPWGRASYEGRQRRATAEATTNPARPNPTQPDQSRPTRPNATQPDQSRPTRLTRPTIPKPTHVYMYIHINCKGVGEEVAILHPAFNPDPAHPFETHDSSNMVVY